ncbi:conserved protein of unknown function [Petrocella atlantisensis]|uniref:PLD phosphodiesterase domain-containing protein n=2 Tax=Petrocella atlantisensis TaxID=2173034 RepID=A0A3P7NWG2_9FIRM|nr:conserved protein of unknown function [Petrocella atlantisensis]
MFDAANNRLSYSEMLQPEIGYELDFAVGLTYSLDLEALLGIPVSFGLLDEVDSSLMRSPFYLLEAIRKSSDRLAVFCNAGGISLPQNIQSVYSLLENSVFEVKLANKQNFHPKVWFAKYINKDGEAYIKLLVLSRNMTFDTSIDLCVELSGRITHRSYSKNKPLADMLTYVSKYAEKTKRQRIIELAEDIMKIKNFEIEHPFEDYEFLPIGITGYDKEKTKLFDGKYDLFAVSPFLSDDVVKNLTKGAYNKTLITRKSSITETVMNSFDSVYITKDILTDNEYGVKQDIHAKLYFTKTEEGNYLYIGSANASHNAFNNNVEFLLKLKYKPNCVGYKTIFKDFIPEDNSPYELIEAVPEAVLADKTQVAIDKAIKDAIYAIKGAEAIQNGDVYDIFVKTKEIKSTETIKITPMQRKNMFRNLQQETVFEGILVKELSEFYILEVQDQKVVIMIRTKGIPKDRDDAIYKSIIDSKAKFLSYISLILAENYAAGVLEETEYLRLMMGNENEVNEAPVISAIYEKMLKVVHQNPSRLKEIADVIRRLDENIIGDDFIAMYTQFENAARRLLK